MFSYLCYGLTVRSTITLPELAPAAGAADVAVLEGRLPDVPPETFQDGRYCHAVGDEAFLAWDGVASFRVRRGREVLFQLLGEPEPGWLRQALLGPVLGVLLHQRGLLVLHGSAVAVDGQAVAFLGWKGQGKSTTAGGLERRGYRLLTDDVVAVDLGDPARPVLLPGIPQLKLWPDSVEALELDYGGLDVLHSEFPKRARRADAAPERLPLAGIYVLDQGEEHRIESLAGMEGFGAVARHFYAARFVGAAGIPPWHFERAVALVRAVPIYRFIRKPSLACLSQALDILEAHLRWQHADHPTIDHMA